MILSKQSVCTLRLYTILFHLKCDEDTKSIDIKKCRILSDDYLLN